MATKPDGNLLQLFRTSRGSIYKTTSTTEGRTWTQARACLISLYRPVRAGFGLG